MEEVKTQERRVRRGGGSTEEFIKNNIKNRKRERERERRQRQKQRVVLRKKHLFMIHHIHSPRQLEW